MKLLVLHVAGLSNGLAKRPDLAAQISNTMEMGAYVPVFPEFPPLPAAVQATLATGKRAGDHGVLTNEPQPLPRPPHWAGKKIATIDWANPTGDLRGEDALGESPDLTLMGVSRLAKAAREFGPRDTRFLDEFRAVDALIGERVALAKKLGIETVVVSEGGAYPIAAPPIDLSAIRERVRIDEQLAHVYCAADKAAGVARQAKAIDKGIKVVCSRAEKALYHIDSGRAGTVVLIAPMAKCFGSAPVKAAQGHLPFQVDDYGVLVASVSIPSIQRRPFIPLDEAGRVLADLMRK